MMPIDHISTVVPSPWEACWRCEQSAWQRLSRNRLWLEVRPRGRLYGVFVVLLCSLLVSACGGSASSGVEDSPGALETDDTVGGGVVGEAGELTAPSEPVPDALAEIDSVGLVIDTSSRCSIVGESFDIAVSRYLTEEEVAAGTLTASQDISAYVRLTQSLGDSLELLSRGDGAIQLRHQHQDIVGLTANLDQPNGSVTAYLAGFAADVPESVILKKAAPGGCLYGLQLPDYCGTIFAKAGVSTFGPEGQSITVEGCELTNPANYPVIELDAFGA